MKKAVTLARTVCLSVACLSFAFTTAHAAESMKKDDMKKDAMMKKDDMKKGAMMDKDGMKKDGMMKKGDMKK